MNFIENESAQKLRGGYYTPIDLASYMARWVLDASPKTVLEPSCGDGVFFHALAAEGANLDVLTGFEIFGDEARKAKQAAAAVHATNRKVHTADFLQWAIQEITAGRRGFDAVLGNPPFVRYQYLNTEAQERAEAIFQLLALPFTKHTNAWVPFVLASIALLRPGGRLGMIIPSEIVHVMHAQGLRTYLGSECSRLLIIDPEEIWFDGTLQGAVILFAEKKLHPKDHAQGLGIKKVKGRDFLRKSPSVTFNEVPRINGKTVEGKWTRALLTDKERTLLDALLEHREVYRFRDIAEVDVGIVTGANKFFLVTDDVVKKYDLSRFAHPMFGRSEHCQGIIYDEKQHAENAAKGNPTNFIWIPAGAKLSKKVREYIELGELENLHTRYKCRIREPWYTVPSVRATHIGMLKRSHDVPRLISNKIGAYTTDTAYRIRSTRAPEQLVFAFFNSLTALSAELEGRHYGGGVLELVPSEIEKLVVPVPKKMKPRLAQLDRAIRTLDASEVLEQQNISVLGALGMGSSDQATLTSAWDRLRNRRQRIPGEDESS
jgi:adenine-specific DNA-methyltransferase